MELDAQTGRLSGSILILFVFLPSVLGNQVMGKRLTNPILL